MNYYRVTATVTIKNKRATRQRQSQKAIDVIADSPRLAQKAFMHALIHEDNIRNFGEIIKWSFTSIEIQELRR